MKKTALLLFLSLTFFLHALTLSDDYTFTNNTIYAKELFPDIERDFIVITIPSHLQHFQVGKNRIAKEFQAQGYTVEGDNYGLVHFNKKVPLDTQKLEESIARYYQKHLPFLEITGVDVKAKSLVQSLPKTYERVFKKQAYKYNKGTVKVVFDSERVFFEYEVHATYSQFQAKETLKKHTPITLENTEMVIVHFDHFYEPLMSFDAINYTQSKRYIKKGKPIALNDIEKLDLVKKGAIVNVKLIEGNIALTFTATALQRGAKGDFINLKRENGSELRAKIVAKNKVLVE